MFENKNNYLIKGQAAFGCIFPLKNSDSKTLATQMSAVLLLHQRSIISM